MIWMYTYNLFCEMVSLFFDILNYILKPSANKGYAFKHKKTGCQHNCQFPCLDKRKQSGL